jgi:hypothetical protein
MPDIATDVRSSLEDVLYPSGTGYWLALLFTLQISGYFLFKNVGNVFGTLDPQGWALVTIAPAVDLLCAVIIAEGLEPHGREARNPFDLAENATARRKNSGRAQRDWSRVPDV